jgi:hypothetical protein
MSKPKSRPSRQSYTLFDIDEYRKQPEAVKKANDSFLRYASSEIARKDRELGTYRGKESKYALIDKENAVLKERENTRYSLNIFQISFVGLGGVIASAGYFLLPSSPELGEILLGTGIIMILLGAGTSAAMKPRGGRK